VRTYDAHVLARAYDGLAGCLANYGLLATGTDAGNTINDVSADANELSTYGIVKPLPWLRKS